MVTMANNSTASYVGWEEVVVSGEKGRREVHYYLKRSGGGGGGGDLVVVGKEKSSRHMSYKYAFKGNDSLLSNLKRFSMLKLRCRREVIDWLNSVLSGEWADGSIRQFGGGRETKSEIDIIKDVQMPKLGQYKTEFTWLGSPWTCRKRRSHYQSFCRNGVIISAQDFVYVLAEEGKRLVAYLDDMYEDTRGNKMVVVRWFHKIDEVDFDLPRDYNDREVFFSLCLQDLSIECIDGLATVLSPEHYKKFMHEATRKGLMPFVCYRQFDNDDVKPFDITRIKGYWKQEILRNTTSSSLRELSDNDLKVGFRPNKRIRWSEECDLHLKSDDKRENAKANVQICSVSNVDSKGGGMKVGSLKEDSFNVSVSRQDVPTCGQYLTIGSEIEVLSQDSGIRGCWFRASIIKKHKDKVKVRYQDVTDAIDGSKNLEEWILASRLASKDALGIRVCGRTIVRPNPSSCKNRVSCVVDVGSIVDAWWNDGWWEGIVVKNESEGRLNVYFPGEKREMIFCPNDLRQSKEWFDNRWQIIKGRPEIVSTISGINKSSDINQVGSPIANKDLITPIHNNDSPQKTVKIGDSMTKKMPNESQFVRDLSKDCLLARLRWKSSGKRRRGRSPIHRLQFGANSIDDTGIQTLEKFFVNSKFDSDNCKYPRDSHFSSSVASPLTSLVMSR